MQSKYGLKIYPDCVLRNIARSIGSIDSEIHELVNEMKYIMYNNNGIGLAAPQVGILKRIFIADIGKGALVLANPVITDAGGQDVMTEGCLSLPGVEVNVSRNQAVGLMGVNLDGEYIRLELNGLMARVAQHEIDHLNGILIIDYQNVIGENARNRRRVDL